MDLWPMPRTCYYGSYDFAAFAAAKSLETEPDTKWYYSSGTANIVARIVRQTVENEYEYYYQFIYEKLFDKIGMYSAILEPDSSGTFVGSSYAHATPRDWARFGQLYLQDGVWEGERILPEGWVTYTTTPTPGAPKGEYGAHFWLNAGNPDNPDDRRWPGSPLDNMKPRVSRHRKSSSYRQRNWCWCGLGLPQTVQPGIQTNSSRMSYRRFFLTNFHEVIDKL